MKTLKQILDSMGFLDWMNLHLAANQYFAKLENAKFWRDVQFATGENEISVFIIRCNPLFTANDQIRNNDWLVIVRCRQVLYAKALQGINSPLKIDDDVFKFSGTADPKSLIKNIANLLPQQYYGNIRDHKGINGRTAICQDNCKVWVARYLGKVVEGFFGINIHDTGGFLNSSLGCFIVALLDRYKKVLKPLLDWVKTFQKKIPVTVLSEDIFRNLVNKK